MSRTAEHHRLASAEPWRLWGPYLADRQWSTVREDYSAEGTVWGAFPHDQARSRAYRWGEDGLLGVCDQQCRMALALALWNGHDPILKERFFGLTGPEGNHGEDVKELYYHLDGTPTGSWLSALYKYPQAAFPYADLVAENARRRREDPEYEVTDTGVFEGGWYFDVRVDYAKGNPEDLLMRVTVTNRGDRRAPCTVAPTLWFRNTWSWGRTGEGFPPRPTLRRTGPDRIRADHSTLGRYLWLARSGTAGTPTALFTDNETNTDRCFGVPNRTPWVKDAFHRFLVEGDTSAVNPEETGTKAAWVYRLDLEAGESGVVELRLCAEAVLASPERPWKGFAQVMRQRAREADRFHASLLPGGTTPDEARVMRQARAGLLWTRKFYYYDVPQWLAGDPAQPPPPETRRTGRNHDWRHLNNRDIISMPDGWEFPWYAAWDLAFHTVPFARLDPEFAKGQLLLLLREWYMHPNGQIPAYEFALGDVNPPVHAWACWRVYKMTGARGKRDHVFLARAFQKLLLNFTWWVNRKDHEGNHLFSGGFLGLDNIGVFDRSRALPTGGHLEQADGTAWMAFYCATMLSMALELAREDPAYEDMATKFFEHFIAIAEAMNRVGGHGLWDEGDGFYYDQLHVDDQTTALRIRSLVGLIPLIACEILDQEVLDALPDFRRRMEWFLAYRPDLAEHVSLCAPDPAKCGMRLLALPTPERLTRVLGYLLDESEFLSPFGIRSLSRYHEAHPYELHVEGEVHRVEYLPGESTLGIFGGNSNWRGPVWFPLNFLLIEALERYHRFFGDSFTVECPTGSGRRVTLQEVSRELSRRLARLVCADPEGHRPCHGGDARYATDPAFRDLALFHEYFHAETGQGLGASHQTGWTALVVPLLDSVIRAREEEGPFEE